MEKVDQAIPDVPAQDGIMEVKEVDKLETFIGSKKQDLAVVSFKSSLSWSFGLGVR